MKPYLVDVPVKINIWVRTDYQKKQWEIIKKARPSILFIQSDGGRNESEWIAINENRKMIDESIDWDCTVYRLYEDKNNGLYAMSQKIQELIWSKVDRCIFTEDDQLPSISFFQYCCELLEKYKDDQRIECICGVNQLGVCKSVESDYFFSRQGSIWGIATWKRVYLENCNFDYSKDKYVMKLLKKSTKHNKAAKNQLINYGKGINYNGHIPGWEFWIQFSIYSQNRLQIIPKYNLISNIGCDEKSEHSNNIRYLSKGSKAIFNMKTYEYSFPLKHAKYVIPDTWYEKKRNRIMAKGHPIVSLYRKCVQLFKMIIHGDFSQLAKKFKKRNRKEK